MNRNIFDIFIDCIGAFFEGENALAIFFWCTRENCTQHTSWLKLSQDFGPRWAGGNFLFHFSVIRPDYLMIEWLKKTFLMPRARNRRGGNVWTKISQAVRILMLSTESDFEYEITFWLTPRLAFDDWRAPHTSRSTFFAGRRRRCRRRS